MEGVHTKPMLGTREDRDTLCPTAKHLSTPARNHRTQLTALPCPKHGTSVLMQKAMHKRENGSFPSGPS